MENIIVGIGELLWDVFPDRKVLGGAPANFAYHASQFGFDGRAVSAIGCDALGNELIDQLNYNKLKHLIERTSYPTGTVQVMLDENGIPQYEICENVAWDNIPFTEELGNIASKTKVVCFGSLAQRSETSRVTINRFLDALPEDAWKIFDINLRQHFYSDTLINNSLSKCNILKINDEEMEVLARMYSWKNMAEMEICRHLLEKYSLKIVILTKGINGSLVVTPHYNGFRKTPEVKVADTVGAGDSFTAGFAASLLRGKSIAEAHETAVSVSAYVCTQHGAMCKLPAGLLQ